MTRALVNCLQYDNLCPTSYPGAYEEAALTLTCRVFRQRILFVFIVKSCASMVSSSPSSSARKEKNPKPLWQWCSAKVEYLIVCLKEYKTEMDYKNIDFNSDVVTLYSRLRESMAIAFDVEEFGPVELPVNED